MIDADVDKPLGVKEIIDPVGESFPIGQPQKIRHVPLC
jgi:hypothetical protein